MFMIRLASFALSASLFLRLPSSNRLGPCAHDLLERDHEAAHLIGSAHRHSEMLHHRRERPTDEDTAFLELANHRNDRPLEIDHEEVRLRRNDAVAKPLEL